MARRLALALAGLGVWLAARPAAGATSCYTEGCASCAPGSGAGNVSAIILPEDFPAVPEGNTPIAFVDPDDGRAHRFVVTQQGRIWVWDGGKILPQPFLDISSRMINTGERGLLAMAVEPDYAESGRFYVYFTGKPPAAPAVGDVVIERYQRSAGDPDRAAPTPTTVLVVPHSQAGNHNGGWLAFGPRDGYLYVSLGDGGGRCDGIGPHGQNLGSLLGKVLRLDVRGSAGGPPDCGNDYVAATAYRVPANNPLVAAAGCSEIWAYGLRNPFRFSFDRSNGDLFLGDVGQNNWEEINFRRHQEPDGSDPFAAFDFGWVCREGCASAAVSPSSCIVPLACAAASPAACAYPTAKGQFDPILCHSNDSPPQGGWAAIIGGYRYRGTRVPALAGRYLYGDPYCGQVWRTTALDRNQPLATQAQCWLGGEHGMYSFAEDHLGELYIVNGGAGRIDCIHAGQGCPWAAAGGSPSQCAAGDETLCLGGGRFRVTASWRTPAGASGEARVEPLTEDSGYLWFFDASNVEAIVKVLDGCALNQRYWVFAAGLTNVEVELRVEDTASGVERVYDNAQGVPFRPIQDTGAFATCP